MNNRQRRKILLVEDDLIAAAVESQVLKNHNYDVITSDSGENALKKIKSDGSIDLVLMDIDLGIGMDGTETAKAILAVKNLPIVFLTSHSEQEMVEKVRGITRYGYISKNSGDFVLQSSIEMAFELFNAHMDLERKNEELVETNRRLREKEEEYRLLFESSSAGIFIAQDMTLKLVNGAAVRILGYSAGDLTTKPFDIFIHSDDRAMIRDKHTRRLRGEDVETEYSFRIVTGEGLVKWVEITSALISWKGRPASLNYIIDVTESRQIEEALKKSEDETRKELISIIGEKGDTDALELSDIVNIDALRLVIEDLFRITGIAVAVIDRNGKILVSSGWQDICTKFHRVNPDTRRLCEESDTNLSKGVEPGKHRIYRCLNNMWDVATPIMADGTQMGNLFIGQFMFDDESLDYDYFRSRAEFFGFDEKEYISALERVPRRSREQIETVMKFCIRLADAISTLSYKNMRLVREAAVREKLITEIRHREEDYGSLFEFLTDAVSLIDNETGRILKVNSAASELYGYSIEELLKMKNTDLSAEPEKTETASRIAPEKPGLAFTVPLRYYRKKDGTVFPVEIRARFFVRNGRHVHIAAARDITERMKTEEKLRRSEEHFRLLTESMKDIVWILDVESERFTYMSPSVEKLRGYTAEEVMAVPADEALTPESYRLVKELHSRRIEELVASGQNKERFNTQDVEQRCKDGSTVWTEAITCCSRNEKTGRLEIRGVTRDISKRRKAEEELSKSRELLNAIQRQIGIGGWEWDLSTKKISWTDEMYRIFECERGDFEEGSQDHYSWIRRCYDQEDQIRFLNAFSRCTENGEPFDLTTPFITAKGSSLWIRTTASPVRRDGKITGLMGTVEDITERKAAAEAIERTETRFRNLFKSIPLPLGLCDREGKISFFNSRFTEVFGYHPEDLPTVDDWYRNAYPDEDYRWHAIQKWEHAISDAVRNGTYIEPAEYNVTCRNGDLRVVIISGIPYDDGLLATFVDITERKRSEEALRESENRYRSLFQNMLEGYAYCRMIYDRQGSPVDFMHLDVNSAFERLTGLRNPVGQTLTEVIPEIMATDPEFLHIFARVTQTGIPERMEIRINALSIYLAISVYCPVKGDFVAVFDNITERKQTERVLTFLAQYGEPEQSQGFFEALACYLAESLEMDLVCIDRLAGDRSTAQTVAVWQDGSLRENISYQLKGTPCWDLAGKIVCCYPEGLRVRFPESGMIAKMNAESYIGVTLWSHNGTPIGLIALMSRRPLADRHLAEAMLKTVAVRAGSEMERLIAEERIKGLLSEKDILLREVHHRIKNNMSTMMGLLSLQARRMQDKTAANALMEARGRLHSMGTLYDKLYRSESISEISIGEYLPALVEEIIDIFPLRKSVKVEMKLDSFMLPVKIVSPMGIIVNELITNAIKYAFTEGSEGVITVSASKSDGHATIVVSDNGKGIPEYIDIKSSSGFGLMLVGLLVEQLGGVMRIERQGGSKFILEFDAS